MQTLRHISGVLASAGLMCVLACGTRSEAAATDPQPPPVERKVVVPERTKIMEGFPCNECHDNADGANSPETKGPIPRPHTEMVMKHMPNVRDCYLCHDKLDRDKLRLITGQTISFDDTPKLCGQCHSARKRDWDKGIHGKQVGSWRGTSHKLSCADCHDPHTPKRLVDKRFPAPVFPKFGVRKQAH